jgi:hypothetical protein
MTDETADRQQIRDLMARYARSIDRMDWVLLRSCYHPEAMDDHGAFRGSVEEFIAFLDSDQVLLGFECTMHTMTNQNVDLAGDRAHCETYCVAYHRSTDRHPWGRADVTVGLRYVDELERRAGQWRILDRVVVHEWARRDPIEELVDLGDASQWGRRGTRDLSYAR